MTARVRRLLLCGAAGYVCAGVYVILMSFVSVADRYIYLLGLAAFVLGLWALDNLLPGPSLGIGERRGGVAAQAVFVVSFVAYWLITQQLIGLLGPGWPGPILFAWTLPLFLLAVAVVVLPNERDDTRGS